MRVIGYARVSTNDQNTIEEQITRIRSFCDMHDHELVVCHRDIGSAKDMNRMGLRAALQSLVRNKADGIVALKLDRITRSVHDWCRLLEKFFHKKKTLLSVLEPLDTTTASGIMSATMLAVVAEYERNSNSERTKNTLGHMREEGRRISRHAPFGYEADPDRPQHWKTCSHEQEILSRIHALHSEGHSYAEIARILNREGRKTRNATNWNRAGVWRVINKGEQIGGKV